MNRKIIQFGVLFFVMFNMVAGVSADQKVLSMATGGSGGTYYAIGGGISKLIEQHLPQYKLIVQSTAASLENIHLVANKRVDFAICMPDSAYFAMNGGREFKGKSTYNNLRAVMAGHPSLLQGAALKKSGIKSFRDLKEKRVPLSAPGSPSKFVSLAALEAYGVFEKDFKPSYLTYNEMVQALKDGTVDASMVFAGVPAAAMLDLSSTFDIQLLPVEDQMLDEIIKKHPYFSKAVIPAKMYGQSEAVPTLATPAILITSSDQPAKVVYDMIKVITDHTAELAAIHKAGAYWGLDDATAGIAIPFHEGATKFLKEKGKLK